MNESGIPSKFSIPWANSAGTGYIRTIPTASQISIQAGAASLTDGFPPATFTPTGSGGTPPFGQDFNGILKQITQWAQWQSAGGPIPYDGTFQSAIGGYPNQAIVASVAFPGTYWQSTTDNNTSNPETGGANWTPFVPAAAKPTIYEAYATAGSYTWTCPANVYRIKATITGGGGGGAGSPGSGVSGGCGGAGGTVIGGVNVVPGQTYAIVVGAGGAGGAAGANAGGAGGTSTAFTAAADGGAGGGTTAGNYAGGAGGVTSGGQINMLGGSGSDGYNGATSGLGGASFFGGGGRAAQSTGTGQNGNAPGAGAGAGYNVNIAGGSGAAGIVIIEA